MFPLSALVLHYWSDASIFQLGDIEPFQQICNVSVIRKKGRRSYFIYSESDPVLATIKLEKESECQAVWCNLVTGNSTLTVGIVYRSPNISIDEKMHNAIKEVSKRDCIIMILTMGI